MGRESRHLWVGNIPDNSTETDIAGFFNEFGEVDKIELLTDKESSCGVTAVVSFMSLQMATKIHGMVHKMVHNTLNTRFYDTTSANNLVVEQPKRIESEIRTRKRTPSPKRGRDIKRRIDNTPRELPRREVVREILPPPSSGGRQGSKHDYSKVVIICHNLPQDKSVHTLSNALHHEFKHFGPIKNRWMNQGQRGDRNAVVVFFDGHCARNAFEELDRRTMFGKAMELELIREKEAYTCFPDTGAEQGAAAIIPPTRAREHSQREEPPVTDEGASSTLFVGNLSGEVRYKDLIGLFKRYGEIECIDIKESDKGYPYAFIRYYGLKSACDARKYLNEETLFDRRMKIGYGKGCPTNTVMAMEIDPDCSEQRVEREFGRFGDLVRMTYNKTLGSALCTYSDVASAQMAIENMRGRCLGRTGRIKVDFANHLECQEFYKNYEQCKASQRIMKNHMYIISQATERYENFRVTESRDRRKSYDDRPPARDSYNRSYSDRGRARSPPPPLPRATIRRDSPPPLPPSHRHHRSPSAGHRRSPSAGHRRRSSDVVDWKGKERIRRESEDGRARVSSRGHSDHHRSRRESRHESEERGRRGGSPAPRTAERSYEKGSSLMSNDWKRRADSRENDDRPHDRSRDRSRERSHDRSQGRRSPYDAPEGRKKKKKKGKFSEEEEEILNSLIARRKLKKMGQQRQREERRGSEKRKRVRKQSHESSTSDDSSTSSSGSSREVPVKTSGRRRSPEPDHNASVGTVESLDRIARIINDNDQAPLKPNSERYSPAPEEHSQDQQPLVPATTYLPPPGATTQMTQSKDLLFLLNKYPIMWTGTIALKNDTANVQLHFLSGSSTIAEGAIGALPNLGPGPMRIAQRMRLEPNQIEGVQKRMQHEGQWCMLLALPHCTDPVSLSTQTTVLQQGFISYLDSKQAAGIINLSVPEQTSPYVLHIFPPCDFTRVNMKRFCPELMEGAGDCGYLLIVIATV